VRADGAHLDGVVPRPTNRGSAPDKQIAQLPHRVVASPQSGGTLPNCATLKGDKGPKGDKGEPGVTGYVHTGVQIPSVPGTAPSYEGSAKCPARTKVLGGGALREPDRLSLRAGGELAAERVGRRRVVRQGGPLRRWRHGQMGLYIHCDLGEGRAVAPTPADTRARRAHGDGRRCSRAARAS
jgi:hypothetical protein